MDPAMSWGENRHSTRAECSPSAARALVFSFSSLPSSASFPELQASRSPGATPHVTLHHSHFQPAYPYAAPTVYVPTAPGKLRTQCDYRTLRPALSCPVLPGVSVLAARAVEASDLVGALAKPEEPKRRLQLGLPEPAHTVVPKRRDVNIDKRLRLEFCSAVILACLRRLQEGWLGGFACDLHLLTGVSGGIGRDGRACVDVTIHYSPEELLATRSNPVQSSPVESESGQATNGTRIQPRGGIYRKPELELERGPENQPQLLRAGGSSAKASIPVLACQLQDWGFVDIHTEYPHNSEPLDLDSTGHSRTLEARRPAPGPTAASPSPGSARPGAMMNGEDAVPQRRISSRAAAGPQQRRCQQGQSQGHGHVPLPAGQSAGVVELRRPVLAHSVRAGRAQGMRGRSRDVCLPKESISSTRLSLNSSEWRQRLRVGRSRSCRVGVGVKVGLRGRRGRGRGRGRGPGYGVGGCDMTCLWTSRLRSAGSKSAESSDEVSRPAGFPYPNDHIHNEIHNEIHNDNNTLQADPTPDVTDGYLPPSEYPFRPAYWLTIALALDVPRRVRRRRAVLPTDMGLFRAGWDSRVVHRQGVSAGGGLRGAGEKKGTGEESRPRRKGWGIDRSAVIFAYRSGFVGCCGIHSALRDRVERYAAKARDRRPRKRSACSSAAGPRGQQVRGRASETGALDRAGGRGAAWALGVPAGPGGKRRGRAARASWLGRVLPLRDCCLGYPQLRYSYRFPNRLEDTLESIRRSGFKVEAAAAAARARSRPSPPGLPRLLPEPRPSIIPRLAPGSGDARFDAALCCAVRPTRTSTSSARGGPSVHVPVDVHVHVHIREGYRAYSGRKRRDKTARNPTQLAGCRADADADASLIFPPSRIGRPAAAPDAPRPHPTAVPLIEASLVRKSQPSPQSPPSRNLWRSCLAPSRSRVQISMRTRNRAFALLFAPWKCYSEALARMRVVFFCGALSGKRGGWDRGSSQSDQTCTAVCFGTNHLDAGTCFCCAALCCAALGMPRDFPAGRRKAIPGHEKAASWKAVTSPL
ncbi:hypothetical protein JHW43_000083 [Diplocarpon mali]|nr:hypothetical protein JHW43_000083 [Diplocarpon mali]